MSVAETVSEVFDSENVVEKPKTDKTVKTKADSSDGRVYGIIGAVIGDIVGSRFEFQ